MKEAFITAAGFVSEMFPQARDIRLEEITAGSNAWNVVLSYELQLQSPSSPFVKLLGDTRSYKQIEVERETGEATSLKMWKA